MSLTERVRLTRRKTGLSQAQLAELVGVNRSAVANWEASGQGGPSRRSMERLAKIAHVSFDWLATGRGEMSHASYLHDVPAAAAALVDDPTELKLLQAWRACSARARVATLDVVEELARHRQGRSLPPARPLRGMTDR